MAALSMAVGVAAIGSDSGIGVEAGKKITAPMTSIAMASVEVIRPVLFICSPGWLWGALVLYSNRRLTTALPMQSTKINRTLETVKRIAEMYASSGKYEM